MLGEMPPKAAAAILLYTLDWSGFLEGDTIINSLWEVPAGLTIVSSAFSTTKASVKLSGGTPGQAYTVTNTITTAGSGETEPESFVLPVI